MNLLVSISGYSYKEWKGGFYPEDLPDDEMLRHYGTQLPAVEINNTFYRLPRASVVESWGNQVPDRFRFAIKASRRITHMKRLRDTKDETQYLLRTLGGLGEKLGVVLFQLPPICTRMWPSSRRPSPWSRRGCGPPSSSDTSPGSTRRSSPPFASGMSPCASPMPRIPPRRSAPPTGGMSAFRDVDHADDQLMGWLERFSGNQWDPVFAFFKHEDQECSPKEALRMRDLSEGTL